MKVYVDKDEWWPVYGYAKPGDYAGYSNPGLLVEVPDELLERFDVALKAFEKVNSELAKYDGDKR